MNIFARTTGGIIGDKFGQRWGLRGRVKWLFIALAIEGVALVLFSRMTVLPVAIASMILFSLFVQMSEGATYSVVPFINKKALGSVAGIVGAGGNMGAVAAGFLIRAESISYSEALLILGGLVFVCSFTTYFVTFTPEHEAEAKEELQRALEERAAAARERPPLIRVPALPSILGDLSGMDLLRMYLGIALMMKGIFFITDLPNFQAVAGVVDFPDVGAWYVVFAHLVGGAALFMGIATRLAALVNMSVILGAIVLVHSGEGLFSGNEGLQFTLFVLFTLLLFVWKGAGKVSFDHYLKQSNEVAS